ncbi:hypothetical protein E3V08_01210 [Candidatus Atribacteria bacterium MT.SAG.1]|nr:hypothetical protein E3V08_01210 [Candidatus Atribacteria bacterium MT.SAG.1]
MEFFKWANNYVKKLNWIDVKLVALASILIGIILVKWIPSLLKINIWWFIIIAALCLAKVYYVIFSKKEVV